MRISNLPSKFLSFKLPGREVAISTLDKVGKDYERNFAIVKVGDVDTAHAYAWGTVDGEKICFPLAEIVRVF